MYPNYPPKSQPPPPFSGNYVPPQQPYLQQPPAFLVPPNNSSRPVFSSMIQPQSSTPKSGGLGKLEAMGRFIKEEPEPTIKVSEPSLQNNPPANLNFRNMTAERPKMSSSVIFAKGSDE